jgi:GT2 family glycosyltransferase
MATNSGFASACNRGADYALALNVDYLLFLNQDAKLLSAISPALEYLHQHGGVGVVAGAMVDSSGQKRPSTFGFPTVKSVALKRFSHRSVPDQTVGGTAQVDYVEGSFFLVKSAVWRALGGMDERYFMYGEERDFCYRARVLGWRTEYIAALSYQHDGGFNASRTPWLIAGQRRFITDHEVGIRRYILLALLRLKAIPVGLRYLIRYPGSAGFRVAYKTVVAGWTGDGR